MHTNIHVSLQVFISDDVDKDHESRTGQWVVVRPHPDGHGIIVLPRIDPR